ncbi:MAG: porphobilinogen synthase [Chlamydiia bacterium]
MQILQRPRRSRRTASLRELVRETHLTAQQLIAPLFVTAGHQRIEPLASLPGIARLSVDQLLLEASRQWSLGIRSFLLFASINPSLKDPFGSEALNPCGLLPSAIQSLRDHLPEACIMSDIALDPFTDHGHDGLLNDKGDVDNDSSIERLAKMALLHAKAGVDMVAPSDMMDGRVRAIREALDLDGHSHCGIMAYTAKYASSLYGPFRQVLGSTLLRGDKRGYQMAPSNRREALREAQLDAAEGADILLVKPATLYLDVIAQLKQETLLPIAAYHVSGEYAMVMAAAERGWLDATAVLAEQLLAIRRAGADSIVTYASGMWRDLERALAVS